ncbi:MAG: NAD(P)H-dependent glycerol-3-phosphate dehydrogenase [Mollicutes bacterium PWAP]|nr:NAD(P)H-dependent glycerol-3-phosphate dehydrogenase [Mollicutes bacterium PWAP]
MKDKLLVIGSGAMGTALSNAFLDAGKLNVEIYGIDKNELLDLKSGHNSKYFQDHKFNSFVTHNDLKIALNNAKYILIAVPSIAMNIVYPQLLQNLNSEVLIINASKGFYPNTEKSIHEEMTFLANENSFIRGVVSLIGPSHAEEIIKSKPTLIDSVSENLQHCEEVMMLGKSDYLKIYPQTDVVGAEIGAAYKNIIAIANGICAGLGYGINSQAALIARGMAEMNRLSDLKGGKSTTLLGLTGLGDIIVTALSDLSRNFTFGKNFAKIGKEALKTKVTVEGLNALKIINKVRKENKLYLPIVATLYSVIFENSSLSDIKDKLWGTSHKNL